jgi:hypothetical protein
VKKILVLYNDATDLFPLLYLSWRIRIEEDSSFFAMLNLNYGSNINFLLMDHW